MTYALGKHCSIQLSYEGEDDVAALCEVTLYVGTGVLWHQGSIRVGVLDMSALVRARYLVHITAPAQQPAMKTNIGPENQPSTRLVANSGVSRAGSARNQP